MNLEYEVVVRLAAFAAVFAAMAIWEFFAPRRVLSVRKPRRWMSNLTLVALNSFLVRMIAPLGAVGIALVAESQGWGLFHNVAVPWSLAVVASVVLLDLAIYLQHVMFHAVPVLWRLHLVHHADLDFDVTTGLRFHSAEILLSLGIKGVVIVLLGPPAVAVLAFEILLNATAMFNHSNVRMPLGVDRVLRWFVVTPDMHRVHHSARSYETNSNFGFNFSLWDRLLGTYRAQPSDGHDAMTIGLDHIRDEQVADRLRGMLLLPLSPLPRPEANGRSQRNESRHAFPSPGNAAAR